MALSKLPVFYFLTVPVSRICPCNFFHAVLSYWKNKKTQEEASMHQKSIAIVNDISGFGRCSVTVALPILSAMGLHCGIVPTAILSNQTEYPAYTMLDFTDYMSDYIQTWKQLGFSFDGIYTGFLGSARQLSILQEMLSDFSFSQIIVDPVMGDHGSLYDSYTREMCQAMKTLISHATLITPNVTELCLLTDTPYRDDLTESELKTMCDILYTRQAQQIVVTGIERENQIGNGVYEQGRFRILYGEKILPLRPGTGDVFASVVAGCCMQNTSLLSAVETAADFVRTCLLTSREREIPLNDGVCFEEHLGMLIPYNKEP
jgi:pyridoxine kinase